MTSTSTTTPLLLAVDDVYAGYEGVDILKGVTLRVHQGEVVCVIGPNGAGKSTVFKALYGFVPIRRGRVVFDQKDVTQLPPEEMLQRGIAIVPQLRSVFPQMSVMENLEMGMILERDRRRIRSRIADILDLFPRLAAHADRNAGSMSGGEQRMLEIGRALLLEPKLLLMDEPSAGLAPLVALMIFEQISRLNQTLGLTVLMIEQNAWQGLEVSQRGYVLELGRIAYEGAAQSLMENSEVQRAFLGVDGRA